IGQILPALREQRPEFGRNVALDSSDLPAYANGQRYKYHGGPEREAFSDLDAGWGHRSAVSTRKGGGYYGFKFNMISCSATDLPLAWVVTSASKADMRVAEAVLDRLPFAPETCSMDKGYDYKAVYEACERRGVEAVVAKRRNSGTGEGPIDRNSDRFKRLYRARSAVEREFGRLKHRYGLTPLRIRGLARVQMHADLCVITRLTTALAQGERQR
ncbi:MAG: transposase, partial [Actinomycetia bacterium]|nr:transposase [Actinomycetes bacterium]